MRNLFQKYLDYEDANAFFFFFEVETGQIIFVNKAWLAFMGIDFNQAIGTTISTWLHKDDLAPSLLAWKAATESDDALKTNFGFCNRYVTPSGEIRYMRWGTSMKLEDQEEDRGVYWFVTAMPSSHHEYEVAKKHFHEYFSNSDTAADDPAD